MRGGGNEMGEIEMGEIEMGKGQEIELGLWLREDWKVTAAKQTKLLHDTSALLLCTAKEIPLCARRSY